MEHHQVNWGRPRDDIYGAYDHNIHNAGQVHPGIRSAGDMPVAHTQNPIVTGTSVIGVKYDKGVIIAADNLASYGSLARFTDQQRIFKIGHDTVIGIGGDISDLQYITRMLDQLEIDENYDNTGHKLKTPHIFKYLSKVMYNRRSKMDPLWNAILVAGTGEDGEPFLSYVDMLGVTYTSPAMATGFGAYLAVPLLRQAVDSKDAEKDLSEEEARKLIDKCMKVLFYRDARSMDKYTVATIRAGGEITIEDGVKCQDMNWKFAEGIRGYGPDQE